MAHRDFGNAIAGLFMLFWLGPVVGIFASLVGEVIGWASWQVAGKSTIPPDRLSGAIAHLLIFAVFGWILVLMFSGR